MAENGVGGAGVGLEKGGKLQAGVRNFTGSPGVGGSSERVYPWDWWNTGISTPGERERKNRDRQR
jgi:hypothetical protein